MAPITTTDRKDFKSLGRRADYTWEILRDRLSQLGPDFSVFLAEPISEAGWGHVDWYVDYAGAVTPFSELEPPDADALLERLWDMRRQVHALADRIGSAGRTGGDKGLADALRRACVTPSDSQFVWSAGGTPVLVCWGFVKIDDARPESAIIGEGLLRRAIRRPVVAVPVAPPPVAVRRLSWSLPLWLLFIALMGAIYYLLLQACGIFVAPEDSVFRHVLPASCHAQALAFVDQRAELEQRIRTAELKLARQQADCTPRPPPPAAPTLEQRLQREGALSGKLQISLSWNGVEDLDLHVVCPGGEVNYITREVCGGKLDVDMNGSGPSSESPVENTVWTSAPPPGRYEVSVTLYNRKDRPLRTIPFTIRIVRGSDVQTFQGSVSREKENVVVNKFTL